MIGGIYLYPNKNVRKAFRIWFKNIGVDSTILNDLLIRVENYLEGSEKLRSIDLRTLILVSDVLYDMISEGLIIKP
ncbi:MAG: hypothetical protein ACFFFO_15305, partial [Candidatus Thorarchaeota archaeon]